MSADHETSAALPRGSVLPTVVTFLVFVIVGPVIGLLATTVTIVILETDKMGKLIQLGTNPQNFARLAMLYLSVSYLAGGVPAILVGLVAAVTQHRSRLRRVSLRAVLLASFVTALIFFAAFFSYPPFWEQPTFLITYLALIVVVHLAAGIGCGLIANGLLRLSRSREALAAT